MTTPLEATQRPVEGLYYPTPVTPEEAFQAIGRLRKEARDEIARLIQFIDDTDDYVSRELEENNDELDASFPEGWKPATHPMEDDEEAGDDEPSLGSVEDHPNGYRDGSDVSGRHRSQETWAGGNDDDCEGDEHDGAEPDHDGEPSLGSVAVHAQSDQSRWTAGNEYMHDAEQEHDGAEPDADDEPSLGSINDSDGRGAVYENTPGFPVDCEA